MPHRFLATAGFGVIFDTFKNTESLSQHRDVSVIVNDGESSTELMMDKLEGCDASIRYHEDRADFSVESMSRAKVIVTGNRLMVQIDGKNDGQFKDCAAVDLPFAMDWAKSAHIGVTASTGQLADNHDVISLTTFSDLVKHDESEALVLSTPSFEKGDGMSQERFERIEGTCSASSLPRAAPSRVAPCAASSAKRTTTSADAAQTP